MSEVPKLGLAFHQEVVKQEKEVDINSKARLKRARKTTTVTNNFNMMTLPICTQQIASIDLQVRPKFQFSIRF